MTTTTCLWLADDEQGPRSRHQQGGTHLSYFWIVRSSTPPCKHKASGNSTSLAYFAMNSGSLSLQHINACQNSNRFAAPHDAFLVLQRTVRYNIWPPMVDLPASTCPMKTMFMCSLHRRTAGLCNGQQLAVSFVCPGLLSARQRLAVAASCSCEQARDQRHEEWHASR